MPRKPRSVKQEMDSLSAQLRQEGLSWTAVGERFAARWNLNSRQALREAHRYTQAQVVDLWNAAWPYEPLSVRKLGAWEAWPGRAGNEPSIASLNRLARLYQCQAADLVDGEDHRDADEQHDGFSERPDLNKVLIRPTSIAAILPAIGVDSDGPIVEGRAHDSEFEQLVQMLTSWAAKMKRRDVLALLGAAASAAYASPMLDRLNDQELDRLARIVAEPSRVDLATIAHIEAVLQHCRRQEDTLGPRAVLETVLAQHDLVRTLLAAGPTGEIRDRLLSLLANIRRATGWMLFNLNDFKGADYYFGQARTAAHEADDDAMCSFVLANWSQLATWRGDARLGVEHALGALAWGQRAGSKLLVSYACDVGARAYAAVVRRSSKGDRRRDHARCLRSLDQARREMVFADDGDEGSGLLHFYGQGLHVSTRTLCLLDLDDTRAALPLAQQSVDEINPAFSRNLAFARVDLARAHTQTPAVRSIKTACDQIGAAAALACQNTSPRLMGTVLDARSSLSPWGGTRPVRELDEKLRGYGLSA